MIGHEPNWIYLKLNCITFSFTLLSLKNILAFLKNIKIYFLWFLWLFLLSLLRRSDDCDMTRSYNVHRRKTDLMPTIPSPRDMCRSSLGTYSAPRTPGSKQMTKLSLKRKKILVSVLAWDRFYAMFYILDRFLFDFILLISCLEGSRAFSISARINVSNFLIVLTFDFAQVLFLTHSLNLIFANVKDAPSQWPAWISWRNQSVVMVST